jgi:hypothetical protein
VTYVVHNIEYLEEKHTSFKLWSTLGAAGIAVLVVPLIASSAVAAHTVLNNSIRQVTGHRPP